MGNPRRAGARVLPLLAALLLAPGLTAAAHATFPGAPGLVAPATVNGTGAVVGDDDVTDTLPPVPLGRGGRWSPDGTMLATVVNEGASHERQVHISRPGQTGSTKVYDGREPLRRFILGSLAWSGASDAVYVLGLTTLDYPFRTHLLRVGVDGSFADLGVVGAYDLGVLEMSPAGDRLMADRRVYDDTGKTTRRDIVTFSTSGRDVRVVPGSGLPAGDGRLRNRADWRPDGNGIAIFEQDNDTRVSSYEVFDAAGTLVDGHTEAAPAFGGNGSLFSARFSPDGHHIHWNDCLPAEEPGMPETCGAVQRRVPDPDADVPFDDQGDDPRVRLVPRAGKQAGEWQPQRQPLVLVHGFAGSELGCGSNDLWLPTPLTPGADLLDLRLDSSGSGNAPGTCGAGPKALLERAYGAVDVYGSARAWTERIAPGRAHHLVWDWRLDPVEALPRLDALVADALAAPDMQAQVVRKVAIVAHSMGGLVTQAFIHDETRSERVARALTVGTPWWGAPKAGFAPMYGVELPEGGDLDALLPDADFAALARTMTGLAFLLPTDRLGPWLRIAGMGDGELSIPDTRRELVRRGFNTDPLELAAARHDDLFADGWTSNGVALHAVVGTGMWTIDSLRIDPGRGEGGADDVTVRYEAGDGTVPRASQTRGTDRQMRPPGDPVGLSFVCGIGHMAELASPVVQAPVERYLLRGAPPQATRRDCPPAGVELRFRGLSDPLDVAEGPAARGGARAAEDPLVRPTSDLTQVIELPDGDVLAVTGPTETAVTGRGTGVVVGVRTISAGEGGTTTWYGPVDGAVRITADEAGAPAAVTAADGTPLPGSATEPATPGGPGTPAPGAPSGSGPAPPAGPGPPVGPGPPAAPPAVVPSPAVPGSRAPEVAVRRATAVVPARGLRRVRGRVAVKLRCPAGTGPCRGRVALAPRRAGAKEIAGRTFVVPAGRTVSVSIPVSATRARRLGRGRRPQVRLLVTAPGTKPLGRTVRLSR